MNRITKSSPFLWSLTASVLLVAAYLVTWQYYAMWWFFVAFADLAVALSFFVVLIRSFIFMLLNRKAYQYAYLPFLINLTAIAIILSLPAVDSNKRYFKWETNLSNYTGSNCPCNLNLHVEYYCVFGGGATATDMDAVYLTDKKNFRLYLGKYDEGDERIDIKCNGMKISVTKTGTRFIDHNQSVPNMIERKTFYLNQLINDKIFE